MQSTTFLSVAVPFNPIDSQVITHDRDFFVLDGSYVTDAGDVENIYCRMKRGTKSILSVIEKSIVACLNTLVWFRLFLFLHLILFLLKAAVKSAED